SASKINYGDISQKLAFNITIGQIEALDLSRANINHEEFSALYSGRVKVTGQQIVVSLRMDQPYIIIEVWANDLTQTTGLLAYLRNLIIISLEQSLKTMEKSDEVVNKITQIFNCNNELRECFDICCKSEKIKIITASLKKIKNDLDKFYPNLKVLASIKRWILKFEGMHEEEDCIDSDTAVELEYNLIEWIKQLRELVIHDIKIFKETYEEFDKCEEEFKIGEENINRNLQLMEKIYGLSILNYIIVVHRDSGLTLYEAQLSSITLNPDLISGFITAIQSFGTEVSKKDSPVTGLKYENYNIEIETGDYIRSVILLNGKINVYLAQGLFNFVKEFENQYEDKLKLFQGNISQFRDAKNLFSRTFGLSR
ncbi:MAG: hypothetical protein HWN67_21835, partial [Candidatus Helarchaeota archaeon]|nr:hypothetical protein [Candidatus Helarchaeota archaeon]